MWLWRRENKELKRTHWGIRNWTYIGIMELNEEDGLTAKLRESSSRETHSIYNLLRKTAKSPNGKIFKMWCNSALCMTLPRWPQQFWLLKWLEMYDAAGAWLFETNPNLNSCFHDKSIAANSKDTMWLVFPVCHNYASFLPEFFCCCFCFVMTVKRKGSYETKNIMAHLCKLKYLLLHIEQ